MITSEQFVSLGQRRQSAIIRAIAYSFRFPSTWFRA
jgi:hypothetical protein